MDSVCENHRTTQAQWALEEVIVPARAIQFKYTKGGRFVLLAKSPTEEDVYQHQPKGGELCKLRLVGIERKKHVEGYRTRRSRHPLQSLNLVARMASSSQQNKLAPVVSQSQSGIMTTLRRVYRA